MSWEEFDCCIDGVYWSLRRDEYDSEEEATDALDIVISGIVFNTTGRAASFSRDDGKQIERDNIIDHLWNYGCLESDANIEFVRNRFSTDAQKVLRLIIDLGYASGLLETHPRCPYCGESFAEYSPAKIDRRYMSLDCNAGELYDSCVRDETKYECCACGHELQRHELPKFREVQDADR